MGPLAYSALAVVAALIAAIYQTELWLSVLYFTGITHTFEPLSSFPYQCRRIEHPRLQACEDMWLSESTRQLFLACGDSLSRSHWMPSVGALNVTARALDSAIVVVDIDKGGPGKDFPVRALSTPDWAGIPGDEGRLYPLSLSGFDEADGSVRLWIVNFAPSANHETGELLDQTVHGANFTVEVFRTKRSEESQSMHHIQTFAHENIATPNRIAPVGDGSNSFWFTNDHGHSRVGWKHALGTYLGWGDVGYCDSSTIGTCRTVSAGHMYPNGLARNPADGLIYVPSSLLGRISAYEPSSTTAGDLEHIDTLDIGCALDNISADKNGDLFVAGLPRANEIMAAFKDPYKSFPATTVYRVRNGKIARGGNKVSGGGVVGETGAVSVQGDSEIFKILEDGKGEVLPAATTVLHDASTGRIFFSSVISPFIGVCEKVEL